MKRRRKILLKPQNQRGANWRRTLRARRKLKKRRKREMVGCSLPFDLCFHPVRNG